MFLKKQDQKNKPEEPEAPPGNWSGSTECSFVNHQKMSRANTSTSSCRKKSPSMMAEESNKEKIQSTSTKPEGMAVEEPLSGDGRSSDKEHACIVGESEAGSQKTSEPFESKIEAKKKSKKKLKSCIAIDPPPMKYVCLFFFDSFILWEEVFGYRQS
jgi:hypothetical protein